jgi:hypothetical protein
MRFAHTAWRIAKFAFEGGNEVVDVGVPQPLGNHFHGLAGEAQ